MVITDIFWQRYKIPFRRTFANRYEQLTFREGVLLFMETDTGMQGLGEVAPLVGFGGTLAAAIDLLGQVRPLLIGETIEEQSYWNLSSAVMGWDASEETARVALSGLCLAFFDLIAQSKGQPLAAYLANGQPTATHIPVNATLGGKTLEALQGEAGQARAQGFTCVKMKVGQGSVAEEMERVQAVQSIIGDGVTLRVDANGAWTMEQATAMVEALADLGVVLVEQPLAPTHRVGMRMLREHFPTIQIAADENIIDINSADEVLRTHAADVLVIKPMIVGGPVDAAMIAQRAIKKGVGVIVTSLLDSGVGIAGALQVAATLPHPMLPCGLATAHLLEGTLIQESLQAVNGMVAVPQGIGLGVTLDRAQLQEFCGEVERLA
jgi:o-succinylbenzoate synthase